LKQLQEVVGNTLEQIGIGNNFLGRTQKAQHLRERINIPMKKWAHELNRQLSKEEVQMASIYMKKCSTSLTVNQNDTKISSHPSQNGCIQRQEQQMLARV
jgi:hypothetical protein